MSTRYACLAVLFAGLLAGLALSPPASAQTPDRVALDRLQPAHAAMSALTERIASPASARLAPFAVASYDFDVFDEGTWLDFENATREFDALGRLTLQTASTLDFFTGTPYQIRVSYTYASNGLLATRTVEEDRSGAFVPTARVTNTYSGALLATTTDEVYVGGAFVPDARETYEYDGDRLRRVTFEEASSGTLAPTSRDTYTYGSSTFPTQVVEEEYDGSAFVNAFRSTFAEVGQDVIGLGETWDGSGWANDTRDTYLGATFADFEAVADANAFGSLDAAGLFGFLALLYADFDPDAFFGPFDGYLFEEWDGANWVPDTRTTLTRDGTGRIIEQRDDTWTGAWESFSRTLITYGANGPATSASESWDGTAWVLDSVIGFDYDAAGNTSEVLIEAADFFTGALTPSERIRYTWTDLAVSSEDDAPNAASTLALAGPNPFSDRTAFSFSLAEGTEAAVIVYDVLGRVVATLSDGVLPAGDHRVAFDAQDLPAGVYVVRLAASGRPATLTVTVAR